MKRRLVLAVTTVALLGGAVGIASAASPSAATTSSKTHQFCLVFYYKDGSKSYECINW